MAELSQEITTEITVGKNGDTKKLWIVSRRERSLAVQNQRDKREDVKHDNMRN